MMKPNLLHPRGAQQRSRGLTRRARAAAKGVPARGQVPRSRNQALARARAAGGPVDLACYTCSCGYLFRASVSTTVACPHCGADQSW